MKIYKNSILLFRINPNKDIVKCYFLFRISLITYKTLSIEFDLKEYSLKQVMEFFKKLSNEWNTKYRV